MKKSHFQCQNSRISDIFLKNFWKIFRIFRIFGQAIAFLRFFAKNGRMKMIFPTASHLRAQFRPIQLASLYFVMTSLTSVGFGNVAANTQAEQVSCVTWAHQLFKCFRSSAWSCWSSARCSTRPSLEMWQPSSSRSTPTRIDTTTCFLASASLWDFIRSVINFNFRRIYSLSKNVNPCRQSDQFVVQLKSQLSEAKRKVRSDASDQKLKFWIFLPTHKIWTGYFKMRRRQKNGDYS